MKEDNKRALNIDDEKDDKDICSNDVVAEMNVNEDESETKEPPPKKARSNESLDIRFLVSSKVSSNYS